jgi:hypothetical protein
VPTMPRVLQACPLLFVVPRKYEIEGSPTIKSLLSLVLEQGKLVNGHKYN